MVDDKVTIGKLLTRGYEVLKTAGIDSYAIDCELLLGKVLKKDRLYMLLNRYNNIDCKQFEEFNKLLKLRQDKMPIKYILGECEFMGLMFFVKSGVLIPRPDTETLVGKAIDEIRKNSLKTICDVCCGSGAIGISIANYIKDVEVVCSDISDTACEVTDKNIKNLSLENRVKVVKSDLLSEFIDKNKKFDMIVSNPPYIKEDVIPSLMEDVREYEPYEALYGGEDGLDFYRKITEQSIKLLQNKGILIFEIGYDQKDDVKGILAKNGFKEIECLKDLAGRDRVVQGKLEMCCVK